MCLELSRHCPMSTLVPDTVLFSAVRLFADDSLLYKHIRNQADPSNLQQNLAALKQWEHVWKMGFHPAKCKIPRIDTNHKNILKTQYHLHWHQLEIMDSSKYADVTFIEDLTAVKAFVHGQTIIGVRISCMGPIQSPWDYLHRQSQWKGTPYIYNNFRI